MEEIIKTIVVGALTAFAIMAVLYALNCIVVWREKKDGIRVVKKGKRNPDIIAGQFAPKSRYSQRCGDWKKGGGL